MAIYVGRSTTHPLPDDDVVQHSYSTEHNSHTSHYTGSDGRSGWELKDSIQNDIYSRK